MYNYISRVEQQAEHTYDNKFFGTDITIGTRSYHIKIHVLMPTPIQIERSKKNPNPDNNEATPKIKWIFM